MWVVGLFLAYVAACYAHIDFDRIPPEASGQLLEALLNARVTVGLLTNVAVHLLLLSLLAVASLPLRAMLIGRVGMRPWLAGLTTVCMAWGAAFSFNQLQYGYSAHSEIFAKNAVWPIFITTSGLMFAGWLNFVLNQRRAAGVLALIGMVGLALPQLSPRAANASRTSPASPNVFIFGIDSLSLPVFLENSGQLPNLWNLWNRSHRYENAHTPLARTCPAWMSVLTGKPPVEHGAVFNLRQVHRTEQHDLLSIDLKKDNYRTVFALDERRFCQIGHDFGFDSVVGPELGVLDFVVQSMNDSPLTNLFLQSPRLADWLKYSRHNVASVANYSADGFSRSVLDAVNVGRGPVFAAVHFESAHFPYRSRHSGLDKHAEVDGYQRHLAALKVVDAQVGVVLEGLRRSGKLDNALLVLLSDHGESFGQEMHIQRLNGERSVIRPYGHGAFLIEPDESHVLLAFTHFVNGQPEDEGSVSNDLVSLTDIRSGVNEFLRDGEITPLKPSACLMVETGVRLDATSDLSRFDPAETIKQASQFYKIGPTGLMSLREEKLAELISTKDIARICSETITLDDAATGKAITYRRARGSAVEVPLRLDDVRAIQSHRQRLAGLAR